MPIAAVAVDGAIATRERRALHGGNPVRQDLGADRRRAGCQDHRRVRIEVPLLAGHAHDRADGALGPEIGPEHVVDEDHVGLGERPGPLHLHRVEPFDPRRQLEPELAAQTRGPGAGGDHDGARVDAPGARLHAGHAALAAQNLPNRSPLEDSSAELGCPTPEAFDRAGGIRVAALGLPRGGADVVDVGEGLQRVELARRQRGGVDTDAAQHLDVLAERVGVRGCDDVHESGVREHGGAAHDLGPVPEDREAGERQARVPLVRVVHANERARATRGAVGERRLLAEHDTAHATRGQRVCDAHAVDSAPDNDDVGRLGHAEYLIMC